MTVLVTDRLVLRPWRDEDRVPFAAMNADPDVMRHFPSLQGRAESDATIDRFVAAWRTGQSFHAVEEKATSRFIGFIGVAPLPPALPIAPGTQVGWRLARDVWSRGYAPEGARATMDLAFADEALDQIVAYTAIGNAPSRRVMEKLGMTWLPELDFAHPAVPEGSPLRPHVVYRITRAEWLGHR